MKTMPTGELIILLSVLDKPNYSITDLSALLNQYGDDWYLIDGDLQKVNDNQKYRNEIVDDLLKEP